MLSFVTSTFNLPTTTTSTSPTKANPAKADMNNMELGHQVAPMMEIERSSSSPDRFSNNVETYSKMNKGHYMYHGNALSPRMYSVLQWCRHTLDSPRTKAGVAMAALIGVPLIAYGSLFPANSPRNYIIAIWAAWDGLLSISSLLVAAVSFAGAFVYVELAQSIPSSSSPGKATADNEDAVEACCPPKMVDVKEISLKNVAQKTKRYVFSTRQRLFNGIAFTVLVFFLILLGAILGGNALAYPSWLWHPLLWGRYHVYYVKDVPSAVAHICHDAKQKDLCLSKKEWDVLSAGALSPHNPHDVKAVKAGQAYAKDHSIVINILARNIKENIPALRVNMESISPFFKQVVLVVYENDSNDGTREEFKKWAKEAASNKKFSVDLMECEGVKDCKFDRSYRDNVQGDYDYSPSIGEMHNYRNKAVQYIIKDPKYKDFSHLMVLDADLSVPMGVLGILHTLGLRPGNAVASTGRQPWPTAFGGFTTPYDLNGFREYNTPQTMGLEIWHKRFCNIMPAGERWHSECDALAPTHLVAIVWNDRKIIDGDMYQVRSAFNGAVLYPIDLLRKSGALYDSGDPNGMDLGQRCEHVGFHAAITKHKAMYVNRKWDMHLQPDYPGGAAWGRAEKTQDRIKSKPKLMLMVVLSHAFTVGIFVWATFALGVYAIQPMVSALIKQVSQAQSARKGKLQHFVTRSNSTEMDSEAKATRRINV